MWITPPCGSIFRCNADHHDVGSDAEKQRGAFVRCGSRYFKPGAGGTVLNCSCAPDKTKAPKHFGDSSAAKKCGEHATVDTSGGVSNKYRRLPMPPGGNPAVKCCRNKPTSRGPILKNETLKFTDRNFCQLAGRVRGALRRGAGLQVLLAQLPLLQLHIVRLVRQPGDYARRRHVRQLSEGDGGRERAAHGRLGEVVPVAVTAVDRQVLSCARCCSLPTSGGAERSSARLTDCCCRS